MILPLFVGRDMSIKAIDDALSSNRMILLVAQKDLNTENPEPADLYDVGTVGMIMRMLKLPDGRVKILVQGINKARITSYTQTEPYFQVEIEKVAETKPPK
ncbi:MAG: LON peptidase substrate-binding domain-containing protein, partial [Nitrospirae bacterium]|nr:LON peptidase substrate-binding domain-containing protein [Nitrospirota bacterium]